MEAQILVWERTTRLEAGLKRELFQLRDPPVVRACRSAGQVAEKRNLQVPAILVLDEPATTTWIADCDDPTVSHIRQGDWCRVIAVTANADGSDWRLTSTGIDIVLSGPVHDHRLSTCCLKAFGHLSIESEISVARSLGFK